MENKILQHLRSKVKRDKFPNFEEMSKEEIIDFIEKNFVLKEMLTCFIRSIYLSVQQSFYDKDNLKDDFREFTLLEGTVIHNFETDQYIFTPNETVKKLLESSDNSNSTKLKDVLSSRFYKMVEYLYLLEIKGIDNTQK